LLQTYDDAPLAVSVEDAPSQIEEEFALTFTVGATFTTMVTLPTAEHPFEFVPVTLYIVVALGLTVILAEVAPVLHT
jgi:hypothetical protein